jgi:4-amino-4-deoxy-L-arabinose transferase-like glycosyltransferase
MSVEVTRGSLPPLARTRTAGLLLGVAGLTLLAAALRQRALGAPFWIDEGLSVGIASHPLGSIPSVLRLDGSPPLYYVLLHGWIAVAGDSERSAHLLSATLAVLGAPAAAWALLAVFGGWAALSAAALVALSPFVGFYADEGRMYSLVFLLAILAAGGLLRVLVLRRRRWAPGCAVLVAALLYTHAWGAFFAAAAGVAGVALLVAARDRRAMLVDLAIVFGGAALLFAPWLPTALEQSRHTAAPWSHAPSAHSLTRALTRMLSGIWPERVLLVAGGAGALLALWRGGPPQRRAILALAAIAATTLMLGYVASRQITPAWSFRYLMIVLAPLLLGLAAGLARLGVVGVAAIAVVGLLMWNGKPTVHQLEHKSNVAAVARAVGPQLPPGTLVFSEQPEQVAVLRYYLPAGLRYATPLGPVADPRVMDWRDAMARLRAARYGGTLGRAARALAPGQRLLLVQPLFGHPTAPWTRGIRAIARSWTPRVLRDRHLHLLARLRPRRYSNRSTVSALLLVRRGAAGAGPTRATSADRPSASAARAATDRPAASAAPVTTDRPAASAAPAAADRPAPRGATATVTVSPRARGPAIAPSALGLSIEWDSVEAYAGPPGRHHTALARLLSGVERAAHSPLALRIGGDSGDQAWWNPSGRRRPATVLQDITPRTLGAVAWLARALHAPVTLGLNLALGDAANALALARAARRRLPAGSLEALEIGNEPDLYTRARTFRVPKHVHRRLRKHARYDAARWTRDTAHYVSVLRRGLGARPRLSVAGFAGPAWWPALERALRGPLRRAGVLSAHLYAVASCSVPTPSMAWLLSGAASRGRARALAPLAAMARRHHRALRVTELNSAACGGRAGLSERFGAALWLADTLLALQQLGARQVDVHTWLHARYAPFAVRGEHAVAAPGLLGMLAVARAAPRGSRFTTAAVSRSRELRAWATVDGRGAIRVALIAPAAVSATVRTGRRSACARLWLAVDRGATGRRVCPPYLLRLPARSLAVLTVPGP